LNSGRPEIVCPRKSSVARFKGDGNRTKATRFDDTSNGSVKVEDSIDRSLISELTSEVFMEKVYKAGHVKACKKQATFAKLALLQGACVIDESDKDYGSAISRFL
jgi:hypothetical protein